MTYQYSRIDARSIRTLEILPAADVNADLYGSLHHISLGTSDPFLNFHIEDYEPYKLAIDAVSYCWEGQTLDGYHRIQLGDKARFITRNVDTILRKLRLSNETRAVWIDGVCINQHSIPERNDQVALMGEFYSRARSFQIWIGPSDASTQHIFRDFRGLEIIRSVLTKSWPIDIDLDQAIQTVHEHEREFVNLLMPGPEDYRGIDGAFMTPSSLSCLSWFSRIWTLQEALISPNNASVYFIWGPETISLRTFAAGIQGRIDHLKQESETSFFSTHRFIIEYIDSYKKDMKSRNQGTRASRADGGSTPGSLEFLSYADKIKLQGGGWRWKYKPIFTVYDILNRVRHLDSSDPRDKIFALQGLLQRLGITLPPPDYSKSEFQVFRETTRFVIEHDNDLDVLSEAITPDKRTSHLPSWVPDWKERAGLPLLWPTRKGPSLKMGWHASSLEPECTFNEDSTLLNIRGMVIHKVAVVSGKSELGERAVEDFKTRHPGDSKYHVRMAAAIPTLLMFKQWLRLAEAAGNVSEDKYRAGGSLMTAFCETIFQSTAARFTPEMTEKKIPDAEAIMRGFREWYLIVSRKIKKLGGLLRSRLASVSPKEADRSADELELQAELDQIFAANRNLATSRDIRRFRQAVLDIEVRTFITTEKGCFGALAYTVRVGDLAALISGFDMPVILRPTHNGYEFLSYGYFYGMMRGETWPKNKQELEILSLV